MKVDAILSSEHALFPLATQDPAEGLANATGEDIPWAASRLATRILDRLRP